MILLNASGCLDALTAPEVARRLDSYVTKTVTPLPREGNPPVRIAETAHGMLNAIGLANPGIDLFTREVLPRLAGLGVPVWVSVGGFSADDYALLCRRLDSDERVSTIELNLSCPNVDAPAEGVAELVSAARASTAKPLYAKLSPMLPDIAAAARAAQEAGADGLTLVNTVRGLALEGRTLAPVLGPAVGGLSGPALKPIALAAVYSCFRAATVPIAGCGGVTDGEDALELVAAGARAVQLGTVLFGDPQAPDRIRREIAARLAELGVAGSDDIFARAHLGRPATRNPQPALEGKKISS